MDKVANLGKVFTPLNIVKKIIEFSDLDWSVINKVIEPSMGRGVFYFECADILISNGKSNEEIFENILYGVEIDKDDFNYVIDILESKYGYVYNSNTKIFLSDFLTWETIEKFDLILGNPPYVSYRNIVSNDTPKKEYIEFLVEKWNTNKISDLYVYFFLKTFDLLSINGKHIFLCSDTWIKSGYGDSIKRKFYEFNVEKIISSPYDVFFPEGTNAIVTIISNSKSINGKTLSYYDGFNDKIFCEIDLKKLLQDKKRNQILVYPYIKTIENESVIFLNDFISGQTSNITFKRIKEIVFSGESDKLFYQDQARINKPAIYKNNLLLDELKYSVPSEFFQKSQYKVSDGVFLASMMDRLPLLFWTDGFETIHTSKYYFLKPNQEFNYKLIYFLLINPITLIDLEINCKDSTNRSLRTGEQGFAKELDLKEVLKLKTIDINSLSDNTLNKMMEYIENWESVVEFNIENVYLRKDYLEVMSMIYKDLKLKNLERDINTSLHLYRKRMRNIKYRFDYL
jgi:hypothetical protein